MKLVNGMSMLKHGQAEIIGGIIAISILLFTIATLYFTLISTQSTATLEFSRRTSFEAERNAEKISISYDAKEEKCIIINSGALDIKIVRVWIGNNFRDPGQDFPETLIKGKPLSMSPDTVPDYIVTARGNVFPIKGECLKYSSLLPEYTTLLQYGLGPFTSQGLVAKSKLTSDDACINITIEGKTIQNPALIYRLANGTWLQHSCNPDNTNTYGWRKLGIGVNYSPDIDGNSVREAIAVDITGSSVNLITVGQKSSEVTVRLLFYNLIEVPENIDIVTIYYKYVIGVGGASQPHDVVFNIYVSLKSLDNNYAFSTPGQTQIAGITKSSGQTIAIVTGYAPFPKFFYNFDKGNYSLELALTISTPSGNVNVNQIDLEYIAVTGARIKWSPNPETET